MEILTHIIGILPALGFFVAAGVGIFRLRVNHLLGHEQTVYVIATVTAFLYGISNLLHEIGLMPHVLFHITNQWFAAPLVLTLILFMLFYRDVPKKG